MTVQSLRVAVIFGGPSSEAAVSRKSAEGVLQALKIAGFDAYLAELSPALPALLAAADVAFPVTHGPLGEDGCLQGLLEVLGLPYVGSDVRASAIAAHKPTAKVLFRASRLPVAEQLEVYGTDDRARAAARVVRELGVRIVVKPSSGGSAIGVTRIAATSAEEASTLLETALADATQCDSSALVETLHTGLEVTCGVLETGDGAIALPPTLVHAETAGWYDFRSRYQAGASRHECPAPLGAEGVREIQSLAVRAHQAVGARDLSRVDFVYSEGASIVLEVNTLPGMTATSNYPEAAEVFGLTFPALVEHLVRRALARPRPVSPRVVPIPE